MFRKILVPIRNDGKARIVLSHAVAVARGFDAHIEAIHCRPRAEDLSPFGVPIPSFLREQFARQAHELADTEERNLREDFDRLVREEGLSVVEPPVGSGMSVSWVEQAGKQVDVIKRHGRLADLIVVAQPDRDRNLGANTLKASLFNTGRPVLMCPPMSKPPSILGERVAIAWNGSLEATRAIALTLDLIGRAKQVTVLTADREQVHGATAENLLSYFGLRGVEARLERVSAGGRIGAQLLRGAEAAGADLLIMGAYGDSHERETIFGGNTQVVVDTATTPVILVH